MRRNTIGLVAAILVTIIAAFGSLPAAAQTTAPLEPTGLSALRSQASKPIASGGWINDTSVNLQFSVQVTSGPLTAQVELQPSGTPFTGTPSIPTAQVSATGVATVHMIGLINHETYHWQARVQDASGNASAWVPFSSDPASVDFGIDRDPPSRPTIHSSTNPNPNRWYHSQVVSVQWSSHDALSGVQGYTFALLRHARVIPVGATTPRTGVRISNLSDGVWFLALRALDRAGNWSPTATYRLALDRKAARVTWLSPTRQLFNPYRGPLTVQFKVSKASHGTVSLYRVGANQPVATYTFASVEGGRVQSITWTGKGPRGHPRQTGYYFFAARFIDVASNVTRINLGGFELHPFQPARAATGEQLFPDGGKRIIVSLSRETLYAYDGTKLVQQTYVTTGNPNLPTPTGTFHVMARFHPYEFISPWPPGSQYWYAPSWSDHALLFRDGGYFLHDAPWRSAFGPGTNGPGQPGTNYGGTHGCVNIPPGPMDFLWNWTPVGTLVEVVP